jgi:hypothetical protein
MARENLTFTTPDALSAYLREQTLMTGEQVTATIAAAAEDGIVLVDNGKIHDARAWEITCEDGTFRVMYEHGYLTWDGRII